MRGFGTVAIGVLAIVFEPFYRIIKGRLYKPDILTDTG
jgi:hypothetical protein